MWTVQRKRCCKQIVVHVEAQREILSALFYYKEMIIVNTNNLAYTNDVKAEVGAMKKVIVHRYENGIVWATINRPEKRNAIDYGVMDELRAIIQEVSSQPEDKILVISGSGSQAFCSGGDLSEFHNLYTKEAAYKMLSKMGDVLYELLTLSKPTVAVLNGSAVGGGCELATACDFRLARKGIKFGFVQGKLAITTGWGGGSMLMERLPMSSALKLLMGAGRYEAAEGEALGFFDKVLGEDTWKEESLGWISQFADQSSGVLKAYKEAAVAKWEETHIKARMFAEIEKCSVLWESDEHHEAVNQFLNN